jgi:hypothetical protein
MKTFYDKLKAMDIDNLLKMIIRQKQEIKLNQRDLETMERVFEERVNNNQIQSIVKDMPFTINPGTDHEFTINKRH